MLRSASASAVPSVSPTGKTSERIGGSDSTRVTSRVLRGQVQDTSSTSITRKAGGQRRRGRPSGIGHSGSGSVRVGSTRSLNLRGAHAEGQPDGPKNDRTAVPP